MARTTDEKERARRHHKANVKNRRRDNFNWSGQFHLRTWHEDDRLQRALDTERRNRLIINALEASQVDGYDLTPDESALLIVDDGWGIPEDDWGMRWDEDDEEWDPWDEPEAVLVEERPQPAPLVAIVPKRARTAHPKPVIPAQQRRVVLPPHLRTPEDMPQRAPRGAPGRRGRRVHIVA